MVGGAASIGMMAGLALTPDKSTRAGFDAPAGTVGFQCREACFRNGLVMRHVGDRMIISPPLVLSRAETDMLIERAWRALDEAMSWAKAEGLMA